MAKKLTVGALKSASTKKFTQRKLTLDVEGSNYELLIDEKFKPTRIQELIKEYVEKTRYCKENNLELNSMNYFFLLMTKHFTNLTAEFSDDLQKQLQVFDLLTDLDILDKIIENFDQVQMNKIVDSFKKFNENMNEFLDQFAKEGNVEILDELVNDIANDEEDEEAEETQEESTQSDNLVETGEENE